MTVRDELIRAAETDNPFTVRRLGFQPVLDALNWWAPKQTTTLPEFAHFAKASVTSRPTS